MRVLLLWLAVPGTLLVVALIAYGLGCCQEDSEAEAEEEQDWNSV